MKCYACSNEPSLLQCPHCGLAACNDHITNDAPGYAPKYVCLRCATKVKEQYRINTERMAKQRIEYEKQQEADRLEYEKRMAKERTEREEAYRKKEEERERRRNANRCAQCGEIMWDDVHDVPIEQRYCKWQGKYSSRCGNALCDKCGSGDACIHCLPSLKKSQEASDRNW